jgi:hypothetical protein
MKPKTDLTAFELYALERAARSARAQEVAHLIRAGVNALSRFARHAVSVPHDRRDISHA